MPHLWGTGCPHLLCSLDSANRQAGAAGSIALPLPLPLPLPLVKLCAVGVLLGRGWGAWQVMGLREPGHHQLYLGSRRLLPSTESPACTPRLWEALYILPQHLLKYPPRSFGLGKGKLPCISCHWICSFSSCAFKT